MFIIVQNNNVLLTISKTLELFDNFDKENIIIQPELITGSNTMTTETEELDVYFEDFDKICRFCYKRSHYLKSIFEEIDEKPNANFDSSFSDTMDTVAMLDANIGLKVCDQIFRALNQVKQTYISTKVHCGDGLPECICSDCHEQLITSNKFRRQCLTATDQLNKIRLAHEEEQKFAVKEEVYPFQDNASCSSVDDKFNVLSSSV